MDNSLNLAPLIATLGFTKLEAQIYVFLLQNSPATGYKIAKLIHRSFTNTYKALESLIKKEAIYLDQGSISLYKAVDIEDLLKRIEKEFIQKKELLIKTVSQFPVKPDDKGIYHLNTANQVYEKGKEMLENCKERVLLELFPSPFKKMSKKVLETSKRGIEVCLRVYNKEHLEGVNMIFSPYGEQLIKELDVSYIGIFIDGKQFLIAQLALNDEGVYDAIWSANPFLARAMYSYVNSDLHLYTLLTNQKEGDNLSIKNSRLIQIQDLFPVGGDLGFKELSKYIKRK